MNFVSAQNYEYSHSKHSLDDKDYYGILELSPAATVVQIETAFGKLVREWQQDRGGGGWQAEARLKAICTAHRILIDPVRRVQYDTNLAIQLSHPSGRKRALESEHVNETRVAHRRILDEQVRIHLGMEDEHICLLDDEEYITFLEEHGRRGQYNEKLRKFKEKREEAEKALLEYDAWLQSLPKRSNERGEEKVEELQVRQRVRREEVVKWSKSLAEQERERERMERKRQRSEEEERRPRMGGDTDVMLGWAGLQARRDRRWGIRAEDERKAKDTEARERQVQEFMERGSMDEVRNRRVEEAKRKIREEREAGGKMYETERVERKKVAEAKVKEKQTQENRKRKSARQTRVTRRESQVGNLAGKDSFPGGALVGVK